MRVKNILFSVTIVATVFCFAITGCQTNKSQVKNQPEIQIDVQSESQSSHQKEEQTEKQSEFLTGNFLGYIRNSDSNDNYFDFDIAEFISLDNLEQTKALGVEPEQFTPDGFYICNPDINSQRYEVNDKTEYQIFDWENNSKLTIVDRNRFVNHISQFKDYSPLFWIVVEDGLVISIGEKYTP